MSRGAGGFPQIGRPASTPEKKEQGQTCGRASAQEKKRTCLYWLTFSRVSENGNGCNAVRRTVCFGHFLRQSRPAQPLFRLCRASAPFVMPLGLRAPAQVRKERKLCPWFAEPTAEPAALLYALLTFVLFEASRPGARSPPPRSPPAAPWARGFQRGRRATFAPPSAPAAAVVAAFASARLRRRFSPLGCAARSNSPERPCGAEVGGCSRFFYRKAKQARSARPCYKKNRSPFLFSSALVLAGAAAGQYDSTPPRPARPAGSLPAFRGAPLSARPGVRAARPCVAPPPPSRYSRRAGRRASRLRALGLRAAQF